MTRNWVDSASHMQGVFQVQDWYDTESWLLGYAVSGTNQYTDLDRHRSSTDSDENHTDFQKKHRKRQWHSKTRTGCLTCKTRKVKCDERRPSCLRCENAHRTCEGYDVPQTQVFDLLKASTPRSLNLLGEDAEGIQGLQFFREKTTPILSNFSAYAADFWQYVVPQIAVSEETIRSLVIAVGCQQKQNYLTGQVSTELARSPAKYYGRALRRLSDPSDPPKTVIVLICCLLFIAMENVKSTNAGIYTHIDAGLRVLREWKTRKADQDGRSHSDLIINYLEPFMARLEAAAAITGAIPITSQDESTALHWKKFTVPVSFPNFLAARESWYELCQWYSRQHHLFGSSFNKDLPEYHDMVALWKRWRHVLRTYEQSSTEKRSVEETWQLRLLDAHYRIHLASIETEVEPNETAWDKQIEVCRKVLNTCARFLDHEAEATRTGTASGFGFNPGVVPPLYSTATVCRDGEIRHQCIDLLKKHHHTWHVDDCSAAAIAEAVASLEEEGLGKKNYRCEDVSEHRRVRPLSAEFPEPGQMKLIYSKTPYNKSASVVVKYNSNDLPHVPVMTLYPLSATVRLAGYQGLVRKETYGCICKAYAGTGPV